MHKFLYGFILGLVTIPLFVFLAGVLGLLPSTAHPKPWGFEESFAQMSLNAYVAHQAPDVADPVAPTEDNLRTGMKIFLDACAGCHDGEYGDTMYPPAPQFAKTHPKLPVSQLYWIVDHGVRYSAMSAWDSAWHHDKAVSDDHIWKAVTFLSHLDDLPPAVKAEWDARNSH